jgi:hypothetical protein
MIVLKGLERPLPASWAEQRDHLAQVGCPLPRLSRAGRRAVAILADRVFPASLKAWSISNRAYGKDAKPGQRLGRIKQGAACETVLLGLLDNATLEPREMW